MILEFSTEEAHRYGIREAIFIGYLRLQILNEINDLRTKNVEQKSRTWIYLTGSTIEFDLKIFSRTMVRGVMESLENQKVVMRKRHKDKRRGYHYAFVKEKNFL